MVDKLHVNTTSVPVSWSLERPATDDLEFLPSISPVSSGTVKPAWNNHSTWLTDPFFTFTNLQPYTQYNITVFVRIAKKARIFPPAIFVVQRTSEDSKLIIFKIL